MNKFFSFLIFIFIASCQQVNWLEAPATVNTILRGVPDIKVDSDYFNSAKYSFIKVKSGRFINFTATLSSIDGGIYKWINSEGHKIYTKNGKIVKISAQSDNSFYYLPLNFPLVANQNRNFQIFLESPRALMNQNSRIDYVDNEEVFYLDKKVNTRRYDEVVFTEVFDWEFVNKYWVDKSSDLVIRSEQNLYPFRESYLIEYYYKFN